MLPLQPITIAAGVVACTLVAAVLGSLLRTCLPDHHLRDDSKDVVKLVMGLIATLVALVLGLLIASANSFYDAQQNQLQAASLKIVDLDKALARYGRESEATRAALRASLLAAHDRIWPPDGAAARIQAPQNDPPIDLFQAQMAKLTPTTEAQHQLLARAVQIADEVGSMRLLVFEQVGNSLNWPFMVILVFWVSVLFLGFGLLADRNGTVAVTLLVGALAIASAAFLILEMNQPYGGLLHLSDRPMRQAIAQISR
jgi:hypothetical protein